MRSIGKWWATVALLVLPTYLSAKPGAAPAAALRFGSVAMDTPAMMDARLTPLTQYLSKALHRPVVLRLSPDMPSAIRAVAQGDVDLAYLTPVAYIRSHALGNTQLVAKMVTRGKGAFQLMIVTRQDSSLKSVHDLQGKTFAFGDRAALLQRAVVAGSGMPLAKLGKYDFIGHYDNIVRAVLYGAYDAGIVTDIKAFKWRGRGIRILYSSPELPPYNITANRRLDPQLLAALRAAFFKLDPRVPEDKAVIKGLDPNYDGFAPTDDAEYDVVRRLIAPFHD